MAFISALVALMAGLASAQGVRVESDAGSSAKKVISITISKNGKTQTYRKVIKDGKVIEESGNPDLLDDVGGAGGELRKLRKLHRKGGKGRKSGGKARSKSRRIIMKDGRIIEDSGDDSGDVDVDFDFDFDFDSSMGEDLAERIREAVKKATRSHGKKGGRKEGRRIRISPRGKSGGVRIKKGPHRMKGVFLRKGEDGVHHFDIEGLPRVIKDLKLEELIEDLGPEMHDLHLKLGELDFDDFAEGFKELHLDKLPEMMKGFHVELDDLGVDVEKILEGVRRHVPQLKEHIGRWSFEAPKMERREMRKRDGRGPQPKMRGLERRVERLMDQIESLQEEIRDMSRENRSRSRSRRSI